MVRVPLIPIHIQIARCYATWKRLYLLCWGVVR